MSKNELGEFLRAQRARIEPADVGLTGEGDRRAAAQIGIPPEAVAEAIGYAIAQPDTVDVNEIVVRATAQG